MVQSTPVQVEGVRRPGRVQVVVLGLGHVERPVLDLCSVLNEPQRRVIGAERSPDFIERVRFPACGASRRVGSGADEGRMSALKGCEPDGKVRL